LLTCMAKANLSDLTLKRKHNAIHTLTHISLWQVVCYASPLIMIESRKKVRNAPSTRQLRRKTYFWHTNLQFSNLGV
jgi:hypothetical protein